MSWYMKITGTKEEVIKEIDEQVAKTSSLPSVVGEMLKEMVNAAQPLADQYSGCLYQVESQGHRPMTGAGSNERHSLELIRVRPEHGKQPLGQH